MPDPSPGKPPPRPRFVLELEALEHQDGVPPDVRLANLLRTALRRDRLRCVRYAELEPGQAAAVVRAPAPKEEPRG